MNDLLAKYRDQLRRLSGEFTAGQKFVVVFAVVAVLFGALMFSRVSGTASQNVVLFANLKPADAAAVTQELTAQGVTYELSDGGTTVMVAPGRAAQARIDLAAKNLPSNKSDGWSIIDNQSMTASEFRQRIDYQRALEGELSRTIDALEPVQSSIVKVVVPRNDVFSADGQKPTASVLVTTDPGQTLSGSQVNAIVNLTAGAVPGLDPADVTVTDANGQLLAAPGMEASAIGADANTSATSAFENSVAKDVTDLLVPVFGGGKVKVQVAATLDYSKKDTVSETVQAPNPTVVTSEKSDKETLTGNGSMNVGGVLGADGLPVNTGTGNNEYNRDQAEKNYAVGKVTETVRQAPGQVQKLSVAVVVDQDAGRTTDLAQVRDVVAAATGVDPQRGDTVQVTRLPFDTSTAKAARQELAEQQAAESQAQLIGLVKMVLSWLFAGVVLLLIWRGLRKARIAQLAALAKGEGEDEDVEPEPAPRRAEPVEEDEPEPTEEELEQVRLNEQVKSSSEVLRQAPAGDLAAIMRNWAQEG